MINDKRPCSPIQSLEQSLKEMKLMREGKLPKKNVKEMFKKLNGISAKADKLTGENGMIELDPNNPQHREWYEEDEGDKREIQN